jgi:hypothetical protein
MCQCRLAVRSRIVDQRCHLSSELSKMIIGSKRWYMDAKLSESPADQPSEADSSAVESGKVSGTVKC